MQASQRGVAIAEHAAPQLCHAADGSRMAGLATPFSHPAAAPARTCGAQRSSADAERLVAQIKIVTAERDAARLQLAEARADEDTLAGHLHDAAVGCAALEARIPQLAAQLLEADQRQDPVAEALLMAQTQCARRKAAAARQSAARATAARKVAQRRAPALEASLMMHSGEVCASSNYPSCVDPFAYFLL